PRLDPVQVPEALRQIADAASSASSQDLVSRAMDVSSLLLSDLSALAKELLQSDALTAYCDLSATADRGRSARSGRGQADNFDFARVRETGLVLTLGKLSDGPFAEECRQRASRLGSSRDVAEVTRLAQTLGRATVDP